VNSRFYTEDVIHDQEIERIFDRVWLIACHES
jgi:phenylpropionate dioxygenase-like ring-hydroxylating dioxygenase large terminal subunit